MTPYKWKLDEIVSEVNAYITTKIASLIYNGGDSNYYPRNVEISNFDAVNIHQILSAVSELGYNSRNAMIVFDTFCGCMTDAEYNYGKLVIDGIIDDVVKLHK